MQTSVFPLSTLGCSTCSTSLPAIGNMCSCPYVSVLQVRPAVIPLLQQLLTSGTFRPSSLDAKTPSSSASSSSLPAAAPQASRTLASETQAAGTAGQASPSDRQEEEQCRTRLIFTAESSVPWAEKLVTQIKVGAWAFPYCCMRACVII